MTDIQQEQAVLADGLAQIEASLSMGSRYRRSVGTAQTSRQGVFRHDGTHAADPQQAD